MIEFAKRRWGLVAFVMLGLASLTHLALQPVGGHYQIFIGATRALMASRSPYFDTFGSPSGTWLYSPSCALFFFRIFEPLPDRLGQWVYVAVSWIVLFGGLWCYFEKSRVFEPLRSRRWIYNLFWILAASEVTGAIANTRLEIIMTGVLLMAGAQLLRPKFTGAAWGLAVGMVTVWKFVSLPSAFLLALVSPKKFGAWLALGLVGFVLLPAAVVGPNTALNLSSEWMRAVSYNAVGEHQSALPVWLTFVHLYRTVYRIFDFQMSYRLAEIFGLCIAFGLAAFVVTKARRVEWALALGAFFSTALMPASQSAGYVQWIPLLGLGFLFLARSSAKESKVLAASIALSFALVSLLSSDFVPYHARLISADFALKAVGSLVLAGTLIRFELK